MIYLKLFYEFLKIGMFTFGGAYGAIPLIRECVISNGWMSEGAFADMLALSESTPGPIMVNSATYIGSSQGGIIGSAVATLGVVLPSFIVIILISAVLKKYLKHPVVDSVLSGIKPCVIGVILATGGYMVFSNNFGGSGRIPLDLTALIITAALAALLIIYKAVKKKQFSPILLIVTAAVLGAVLY